MGTWVAKICPLVLSLVPLAADAAPRACTVSLRNEDTVRGQLEAIGGGLLTLRPAVAPVSSLSIDLEKVSSISFGKAPGDRAPGKGDVLALQDGSRLCGKFLQLGEKSVQFEFEQYGRIELPHIVVKEIARQGPPRSSSAKATHQPIRTLRGAVIVERDAGGKVMRILDGAGIQALPQELRERAVLIEQVGPDQFAFASSSRASGPRLTIIEKRQGGPSDQYVVTTTRGDVLTGDLRQLADGPLEISGGAVEARLPYASVAKIVFPQSTSRPQREGLLSTVVTRYGSSVVARDVALRQGRLELTLRVGPRVSLPLETVRQITITGKADAVLVWTGLSDFQRDVDGPLKILRQHFGPMATPVLEDRSGQFGEPFQAKLACCRVLVLPRMSRWDPGRAAALAAKLRPLAAEFGQRAGTIVILRAEAAQIDFLRQAGLIDVQADTGVSGSLALQFTEKGRPLTKGVGTSSLPLRSARLYRPAPGSHTAPMVQFPNRSFLAGPHSPDRGASLSLVVGRKISRGHVILIGLDYAEHDERTRNLLINAVTYGWPQAAR